MAGKRNYSLVQTSAGALFRDQSRMLGRRGGSTIRPPSFAFWSIPAALAARLVVGSQLIVLRAKETVVRKVTGFMEMTGFVNGEALRRASST
jgi:hypothetical protein